MFNVISISSETLTSNIASQSMINQIYRKAKTEWVLNDNEKILFSNYESEWIELRTSHAELPVKDWEIDSDFGETVDNDCDLRLINDDDFISLFDHVHLFRFINWALISESLSQNTILSQNSKIM